MYSLTVNTMISMKAMRIICNGLVLPSKAPYVINTAAAAKSAVNNLQGTDEQTTHMILCVCVCVLHFYIQIAFLVHLLGLFFAPSKCHVLRLASFID